MAVRRSARIIVVVGMAATSRRPAGSRRSRLTGWRGKLQRPAFKHAHGRNGEKPEAGLGRSCSPNFTTAATAKRFSLRPTLVGPTVVHNEVQCTDVNQH